MLLACSSNYQHARAVGSLLDWHKCSGTGVQRKKLNKKAIKLDPEDAVAYNNLGLLEEKLGYEEQAKRRFEIADALVKDEAVGGRSDQEVLGKALDAVFTVEQWLGY